MSSVHEKLVREGAEYEGGELEKRREKEKTGKEYIKEREERRKSLQVGG